MAEEKPDLSANLQNDDKINEPSIIRDDEEADDAKYPYPKSIAFIISNEFCERFSFYGMRTILSLYLSEKLAYSDDDAVVIYHAWTMLVYFFPIFGAMIADSWLGRFNTILYLSVVYSIGNILISITSIPMLNIPTRTFTMIGLMLVAVGTGGIKPNVSAFGGDQFKLPQQAAQLATFFSLFYFSINAGSFISTFVTPILRLDVHCFEDEDCYSLAFGVPGILMIVSIVILLIGKSLYVIKKPSGNVLLNVFKCIGHAISRRGKIKKQEKKDHWLDYADDKYKQDEIKDIKAALKVLLLFIPLPVFWALFDQQGSRWTFQATRMDGAIGSFIVKPDQMQVVNPLLILLFIPIFEVAIYPALKWCRLVTKPLHKIVAGGLLAAIAFIISAIIEIELEKTYPILPTSGNGHLRLYNGYNCDFTVNVVDLNETILLKSMDVYENKNIKIEKLKSLRYMMENVESCAEFTSPKDGSFLVEEGKAISYYISSVDIRFEDDSDKSSKGYPAVRVLKNFESSKPVRFVDLHSDTEVSILNNSISRYDLKPSKFNMYLGEDVIQDNMVLELGAVYTILVRENSSRYDVKPIEIAPPNTIHMMWLLPQYILITMGEVMFSVTGLEFAFTQAPASMKSVLTAGWLLTVAFGNLIVVIVAETKGFSSQADEFFLFAGLMIVDMVIFWFMSLKYEYVDNNDESVDEREEGNALENMNAKPGTMDISENEKNQ